MFTVQQILIALVAVAPLLLTALYYPAIQYERGGIWYIVVPFFTVPALLIDILFNVVWATLIYRDMPFKKSEFLGRIEITFSDRLERFIFLPGKLGAISRFIACWLNRLAPSGKHIRSFSNQSN